MMGGDLKLKSKTGEGTTFYFDIIMPKDQEQEPLCELGEKALEKQLKVLVIDDNKTSLSIIKSYLDYWDFRTHLAQSTSEATEKLTENDYDVIFIDTVMPDIENPEEMQSFHEDVLSKTNAYLIIMPPSKSAVNLSIYADMGLERHIYKPVLQQDLKKVLDDIFEEPAEEKQVEADEKQAEEEQKPVRILLAEDQKINRKIVSGLLLKYQWEIVEAVNGEEAKEKAINDHFDIILMDVQMPKMDGYEATRQIRAHEEGKDEHIPIIAMTAHAMKGDREKCLAAGMDHYLAKPINTDEVVKIIKDYTSK